VVAVIALAAPAACLGADRTEQRVASAAPDAKLVTESYVRVKAPLPASVGAHPEACDWVSYLRFRNAGGPRSPSDADAVITAMPGFLSGAAPFDQLARNFVRLMDARGKNVEFWALDRRSNCLEDHRGLRAAARARDASVAFDYYWRGRPVDGVTFGGWKSAADANWLRNVGVEQTVRDWNSILTNEIPSRAVRRRKVFCGGHSLGGPLTTAYAGWDFDGNPATTADAGYEQCAGFFGLDTSLGTGGGNASPAGPATALAAASAGAPFVSAPPFTPETLQVPGALGVAAFHQRGQTQALKQLPHSTNIDLSQRVLFSRDAAHFATGTPSIRDFNTTNEAALAGIFDDNSEPITILRASLGSVEGGPLVDKNFPSPGYSGIASPLTNNDFLALPNAPQGPLYRWRNYDDLDAKGAPPMARNSRGEPYTSARSEVSDLYQFARVLFEPPADFVEQYFPTRIFGEAISAESGDRSDSLADMRHDGISKRPAFLIQAGDSEGNTGQNPSTASRGEAPNRNPLSGAATLRGYNHIDVTTASRVQNDGRPERSSTSLADFTCRVLASCAPACLSARSPIGPRGIGRIRLGSTRSRLTRLRVKPTRRTANSFRYCVKGGSAQVRAVFSRRSSRGRAELVATTARGHGNRRVRVLSRTRAFLRAYPRRRQVRGIYRASPGSPRLFGIRAGRVRYIAVANRRLLRKPSALRRALKRAGVR